MRHLYSALRLGLWGPYGEYTRSYYQLAKQNETSEILRATAMGKKFKPTPFPEFHVLFPAIDNAQGLGFASAARAFKKQQSMAQKSAIALGGNVPDWIAAQI